MKKIMFNDRFLLTQAVLDGRKTQTRRIVPQKELDKICLFQKEYYDATFDKLEGVELLTHYFLTEKCGKLPYNVGEVVAVAQSYKDCLAENPCNRAYFLNGSAGWKNKMFVSADKMIHRIRITNVRIQRLQAISDDDCLKEGIRKVVNENGTDVQYYVAHAACFETPREAFAHLIDKVSKKGTWERNPYVWVYDFELIK